MLKFSVLCLLFFATSSAYGEGHVRCKRRYAGIGCFKDLVNDERSLPKLLFNNRTGEGIHWKDFPHHVQSVVCQCAEAAADRKLTFFAVQFFGECWAGKSTSFLNFGDSKDCVDSELKSCLPGQAHDECVGNSSTNFVYGLLSGPPPEPEKPEIEQPKLEGVKCPHEMFIVIVMDTSGSVSHEHLAKYKEFGKKFIKMFDKRTKFSLMHYDHRVFTDFDFTDNQDRHSLAKTIDAIDHTRGSTVTQRALALSRELFISSAVAVGAPKRVCVLTDGRTHGGKDKLKGPVDRLQDDHVEVRAVGIGSEVDYLELKEMGGKPGPLLVPSFDELPNYLEKIKALVCTEK